MKKLLLLLPTLGLAIALPTAAAQAAGGKATTATTVDSPVIAVHYQDIAEGESATIDLLIPPPLIDWTAFDYSADSCLHGTGVLAGPPEKALIVRFELKGQAGCVTRVDLLFSNGSSSWPASAVVIVNRLPPAPPAQELQSTFSTAQIRMPYTSPAAAGSSAMLLGLTNTGEKPLRVIGFGNDDAFASWLGQAFRYDPEHFNYRYEDLLRYGSGFEPTDIAPGESVHFALIIDAHGRLPTGAGTLTLEAVALVEVEGQLLTLSLPRLSSAWGTELP